MSDYSELKRLAAAIESCTSIPEEDEAAWMRRTTGRSVCDLLEELQNLRTDNAQLLYALKQEQKSYLALQSENEDLRKDSNRINWLDKRSVPVTEGRRKSQWGYSWTVAGRYFKVREAIDYAMSKEG